VRHPEPAIRSLDRRARRENTWIQLDRYDLELRADNQCVLLMADGCRDGDAPHREDDDAEEGPPSHKLASCVEKGAFYAARDWTMRIVCWAPAIGDASSEWVASVRCLQVRRIDASACILSALPSGRKTMNACGIPNWTGSVISPERHVYVAVDNADALLPASTRAV
jgi:hypothetical protein